MIRRPALLLLVLLGCWLVAGVATAGPAAAHAELASTDPAEGARLEQPPDRIAVRFTEPVSLGAGYARLVDAEGTVLPARADVDGDTLTVVPRGELSGDQGYLVTYRVVSADSHPVAGSFSFTVGDAELVAAGADPGEAATDPGVAVALPVARWIGFAGLALGIGVPATAALCWPGGWASARLRRMTAAGLGAVALGGALGFLLQGPYAAAAGLGAMADPGLMAATADSQLGLVLLARVVLAAALLAVVLPVLRRGAPPTRERLLLGAALAGALVLGTAAVGHPVAGPYPAVAIAAASVHVAAAALWLGGLATLLAGVLRPDVPAGELAAALPAFSRVAAASVGALVLTGVLQSVREVGSPTGLFSTGYGRLLLAKLALVLLLLAAAGVSRVWVQQHLGVHRRPAGRRRVTAHAFAAPSAGDPAPSSEESPAVASAAAARAREQARGAAAERGGLRRSVLAEAGLAAAVLALSAVLVGSPPARATAAQPVDVTLPLQAAAGTDGSVQISLDPARPGANTLHLYLFDDAGRLRQPADIRVTLTEPAQRIGPLAVDLAPAGPGHYVAERLSVPGAGTWTLTVSVRLDEFTAATAGTDFPVR